MVNWIELPVLRCHDKVSQLFDLCSRTGAFIAGGFARHVCDSAAIPAEDIDIFTGSDEIFQVTKEYLNLITYPVCSTEVSIRFDNGVNLVKPISQPRFRSAGTRDEILSNFDITLCEAWVNSPKTVIVSSECFDAMITKKIVFRTLNNPCGTIWRTFKYCQKGYKIDPPEIVKLFQAYDRLSLEDKARINSPFLPSQLTLPPPTDTFEEAVLTSRYDVPWSNNG